jgi:hypothetical protein
MDDNKKTEEQDPKKPHLFRGGDYGDCAICGEGWGCLIHTGDEDEDDE